MISTGNPCPICRDEYLVLDPKNTKLLEQFISPFTGEILEYRYDIYVSSQRSQVKFWFEN